jgi:hypothetical protein
MSTGAAAKANEHQGKGEQGHGLLKCPEVVLELITNI